MTPPVAAWSGPPWPMALRPILKPKVWGGDRLARFPAKGVHAGDHVGESWEASGLPGDETRIHGGPFDGRSLPELSSELGESLLGPGWGQGPFPLLLKIIDAQERLSLQVHPPQRPDGQGRFRQGKAEAWYVLEDGEIVLGLAPGADPKELARLVTSSQDPTPAVNRVRVRQGQAVPIPPGTLHCIGSGVMLVEVQQPADITYRVHDWGRTGRELHLTQAMEVLDATAARPPSLEPLEWRRGNNRFRFHLGCRHFGLETAHLVEHCPWVKATEALELLLVLEGRLRIGPRDAEPQVTVETGDTVLLPAACPEVWVEPEGPTTLLSCYPCRLERELYDRLMTWGHTGAPVAERIFPG